MSVEPFKYLLQPIAIERDEDGRIVGEQSGEVVAVYSAAQAVEMIEGFESQLGQLSKPQLREVADGD